MSKVYARRLTQPDLLSLRDLETVAKPVQIETLFLWPPLAKFINQKVTGSHDHACKLLTRNDRFASK